MKETLTRLIENPKVQKALAAGIAWVITWAVTKFGLNNGQDWSATIATAAAAAAAWLVAEIRAHLWKNSLKEERANVATIQRLLPQPLAEDGKCDSKTVAAVAEVIQTAAVATDGAYPAPPPARPVPGDH